MFFRPSSYFCIAHRIKGYICTFSLMTDLTRCRWCWPRNSRWTQIRPNEHVVHSSQGRGGWRKGGQRSFSVQRPATNRLPSPFGSPARPRQIDKDLSECPTVICHSLRHTFLNLSTYSDNFKGAFIHWTLCNAISPVFLDSHNLIGLIS